jgi:hypothetical protein
MRDETSKIPADETVPSAIRENNKADREGGVEGWSMLTLMDIVVRIFV